MKLLSFLSCLIFLLVGCTSTSTVKPGEVKIEKNYQKLTDTFDTQFIEINRGDSK